MARDFDRQVAELQVRAAVLNRFTRLGTPITAYFGDRDRPFRRIVTAAQRAVLRPEILVHAVTMM